MAEAGVLRGLKNLTYEGFWSPLLSGGSLAYILFMPLLFPAEYATSIVLAGIVTLLFLNLHRVKLIKFQDVEIQLEQKIREVRDLTTEVEELEKRLNEKIEKLKRDTPTLGQIMALTGAGA